MPVHVVSTYSTTSSRVGVNSGFKLLLALFVADGIPDIVRTHHDSEGTVNGMFSHLRHDVGWLNFTTADPVRSLPCHLFTMSFFWGCCCFNGSGVEGGGCCCCCIRLSQHFAFCLLTLLCYHILCGSTIFQVPSCSEQERDEIKAQVVAAFGEATRSNRNQPIAKQFYEMALTANPTAVQVFHRQCWDRLPIKVRLFFHLCVIFSFSSLAKPPVICHKL